MSWMVSPSTSRLVVGSGEGDELEVCGAVEEADRSLGLTVEASTSLLRDEPSFLRLYRV